MHVALEETKRGLTDNRIDHIFDLTGQHGAARDAVVAAAPGVLLQLQAPLVLLGDLHVQLVGPADGAVRATAAVALGPPRPPLLGECGHDGGLHAEASGEEEEASQILRYTRLSKDTPLYLL